MANRIKVGLKDVNSGLVNGRATLVGPETRVSGEVEVGLDGVGYPSVYVLDLVDPGVLVEQKSLVVEQGDVVVEVNDYTVEMVGDPLSVSNVVTKGGVR